MDIDQMTNNEVLVYAQYAKELADAERKQRAEASRKKKR